MPDAIDRLLLDEASADVRAGGPVAVVDDVDGSLTLGLVRDLGAKDVRVHQDLLSAERALFHVADRAGLGQAYKSLGLDGELLAGVAVVLLRLPKSLAALENYVETIARYAAPDVTVYGGGRVKHLSFGMNDVLRRYFAEVRASLARQKARVLIAGGGAIRPDGSTFPRRAHDADLDLWVCAYGAVFAGAKVDLGTRFLLGFVDRMAPGAAVAMDLGCGSGIVAAYLARARPALVVLATDDSAAAIDSATATAVANGLGGRVRFSRDDATREHDDASIDLIVCNPPFHAGTAVDASLASRLFRAAARTLRPGGQLWTVFNSHLGYADELSRVVGRTQVAGRNPKFTVTVSTRRSAG